ncbi:MAG: S9 family peptidase, partial [Bdellovibrionales bacterium]|nr:S9 family peptidase [Bdellovibrionales bacterium]
MYYRVLVTAFIGFLAMSCTSTPATEKKEHIHEIHGDKRVDNYHWLKDESRKDPKVLAHLKEENEFTDAVLSSTKKLQEVLFKEMVSRLKEDDTQVPYFYKGFYYYSKTEKGKNHRIYCRRKGSMTAPEETLLDMNELAKTKKNVVLGDMKVSPDQKILAYSVDDMGKEVYTLFFKDIASGKLYSDKVENISGGLTWAGDNRHIFFTKMNKAFRHYQAYRYRFGGNGAAQLIFEEKDELFDVGFSKSMDGKYIFLNTGSFTSNEIRYIDAKKPLGALKMIQPRVKDLEYSAEHRNGYFYILNNHEAINFKISRAPVRKPSLKYWSNVVKHDNTALLLQMHMQNERLIYTERRDGLTKVRYVNMSNLARYEIQFSEPVYSVSLGANPEFNSQHLRLNFESPITPAVVYDYDFKKREFFVKKRKEVPNFDSKNYLTKRVMVRSRDSEQVPVTLVYSKDYKKDGEAPMLLYGYGSYGITITPRFRSNVFSLIDRGFVFALAHIRGSQAKGRMWYERGKLRYKQNTFNDFEDVAKAMMAAKYVHPEKLVIRGGSAGGLLMGAVTNMSPQLYAAVIAEVPFVDVVSTILDPNLRFSTQEYQQWGNPNNKADYDYMMSYSPYDNVKKQ